MLYPNVGWTALPNTAIQNYCPDYFCVLCARGVRLAALSFSTGRARGMIRSGIGMVLWGGGHGDYHGNEIYTLELRTARWRVRPTRACLGELLAHERRWNTSIRHTYDTMVYVGERTITTSVGRAMNGCGLRMIIPIPCNRISRRGTSRQTTRQHGIPSLGS